MTSTYKWTTTRGAKIIATITAEHITRETISADGWTIEVDCDRWMYHVDSLTVNGRHTKLQELRFECNRDCILIDRIGKDKVLVALPEDVVEAVYGEERSAKRRKSRKEQIETCREMIKAAEAQKDIPTEKEARIRINQWNERYNESGEGWCPSWVTEEQYVSAKAKLTRLLEEDQNDQ